MHSQELSNTGVIGMFYYPLVNSKLLSEATFKLWNTNNQHRVTFLSNFPVCEFNFLSFLEGFRITHDDW